MEATAFRTEGGRRLTARSRGKIRFLSADEVIRVLHKGRKAFFYCRDGRLTEGVVSLGYLSSELECFKEEFVRISRNEYVNFSYVDSIEGKNMILTNGVRCMISRARVKEVTEICCLRFSSVNSKGKIIFLASKCAKCNIKRT